MKFVIFVSSVVFVFSSWTQAYAADFSVNSPTIRSDQPLREAHVFNGFGCDGQNVSPALNWNNPPAGTQSFAITMYDPDAPTGAGWWHWVVYNIPASAQGLPANAGVVGSAHLPSGAVQGRTDFGVSGYGGACPPKGSQPHRYQITVHALGVSQLTLPADASAALVGFMIHSNRLGSASLQVEYAR